MIHVSQQSAHDGCEGDFGQFPLGAKALIESAQHRVATGRAEGGHVQGQAHFRTAPADTAHSLHLTAFSGPRSQAGQGRHFLAVQAPQFGHMSQDQPGGAGTDALDFIQAVDALLQRGILLEQGFNLFFHRLDLGLEMGHELGMLPADKRILMMLGLGFGQGPPMDQLLEPLGQGHQLVLGGRSGWRRFWLIALAIIGQAPRVDPIGFGPLALGLGGGAHPGRIGHRDGDQLLMQALDQGAFIATGGFANHVNAGNLFELSAQLVPALRGIGELTLLALQMKLQGGFGDIHAGVDDWGFGFHSCDRVLTHPYLYELTGLAAALATVRVWSTGRARLWLGYGLAQGRPRVARARARRRSPFAQGRRPHVLACARKARDRKERSNQMTASPQRGPRAPGRRFAGSFSLRGSTPARYARLRGTAQREALPCRYGMARKPESEGTARNHIQRTYKDWAKARLEKSPRHLEWVKVKH